MAEGVGSPGLPDVRGAPEPGALQHSGWAQTPAPSGSVQAPAALGPPRGTWGPSTVPISSSPKQHCRSGLTFILAQQDNSQWLVGFFPAVSWKGF